MSQIEDKTLIEQTLNGDTAAFDLLVKRYWQDLYITAKRYLASDAEDVIQDALTEAYLQLPNLKDSNRFLPWLHTIVRNRALSLLRRPITYQSYEETNHNGSVHVNESLISPAPDEYYVQQEERRSIRTAIQKLPNNNRQVTALYYLQEKSYAEIARELELSISTIEGRLYRARKQLKEELLKMADIDTEALQSAIEKATKGLRQDINNLKQQIHTIQREDDRWIEEARHAAGRTMTQLPTAPKNPITWGIVGGYRVETNGSDKRRIATWSMGAVDEYLDMASDKDIVGFAKLFTDPVAVDVIRTLVYGGCTIDEIAKDSTADNAALTQTLDNLEASRLISRHPDGLVKPVKDTVPYFLTFVALTALYHGQSAQATYGHDASLAVMKHVAQDLAQGKSHPPPTETFQHLSDLARIITLFQAIPLSLSPNVLASAKMGEKIHISMFNSAQQDYMRAAVNMLSATPKDFGSILFSLDPTHEKGDDHAHIVIEADNGSFGHHIDAFLTGTARPDWY